MSTPSIEQYLQRRRSSAVSLPSLKFDGTNASESLPKDDSSSNVRPGRRGSIYSSEPLWQPKGQTVQKPSKISTKGNLLDKSTLYSLQKENIADADMSFRPRPPFQLSDDFDFNVEQKKEREYIVKSHLQDNSSNKFSRAIIQHFFKAPAPRAHPGYGMPRPETSESNPFRLMMRDLQRDPSMLQINAFPSLTNPVKCERGDEFCEILGPCACSFCIERTNRYIGDELQRILFPMIDLTRQRLVQPKLARVLKEGHLMQVRKRRLKELHFPPSFGGLKRKETQIHNNSANFRKKRSKKHSSYSRTPLTPGITLTTVKEESVSSA